MELGQEHSVFRSYLRAEFLRRCRTNPRYSLRSFARFLDYDVSSLSKILQGKRPTGPKTIRRFGARLGLEGKAISQYVYDQKIHNAQAAVVTEPGDNFHELSLDTFEIISDWHHYAILELTHVKNFRPSVRWVSSTLGISVRRVELAVNRLQRAGLLKITERGKWIELKGGRLTTTGMSGSANGLRKMQRQLLLKALAALDRVPVEERDHSSMTMAISTKKLPRAKEKIRRFRRELCDLLGEDAENDSLYALTVALFPLLPERIDP